jgi:hypothetical protein
VIVTVVEDVTAVVETGNGPLDDPAGIVNVAGTLAAWLLLDDNETVAAAVGAGVRVTVP